MSKTMDQRRAAWAWVQTDAIKSQNWFEKYAKLAEGTAATILQCGLGQTVAFYSSKTGGGDRHYRELLCNLASWLCEDGGYNNLDDKPNRSRQGEILITEIMDRDRDHYHTLTNEALEYLIWLKRFGKALEKGSNNKQEQQETVTE